MPSTTDGPAQTKAKKQTTDFTQWMAQALERQKIAGTGVDIAEVGRRANSDYNYIWRVSTGQRNPSLEMVLSIGRALGDPIGALRAAHPQFLQDVMDSADGAAASGIKRLRVGETPYGPIEIAVPDSLGDAQLNRILMAISLAVDLRPDQDIKD